MNIPLELRGDESKFLVELKRNWRLLAQAFNGKITFGDGTMSVVSTKNMDGSWIAFTGTGANQIVVHQLNRPIVGFLVFKKDAFDDAIFVSSTTTALTVKTQNVGTHFLIFVV